MTSIGRRQRRTGNKTRIPKKINETQQKIAMKTEEVTTPFQTGLEQIFWNSMLSMRAQKGHKIKGSWSIYGKGPVAEVKEWKKAR